MKRIWWVVSLIALLAISCSVCEALPFGNVEPTWPAPQPTTPLPTRSSPPPGGGGGVLFQDDFEDPNSGWEVGDYVGGSVGYRDGYYYVLATDRGSTMWAAASRSFTDVAIDVEATQAVAPPNNNNDYGVICRLQPDGNGYYFVVSGDGFYAIYRAVEGEFEPLVDFTPSDVIRQGNATNHIRAVCKATHLVLFVNGEKVAEAEDATFAEGDIGLTATTYEDRPTEIHFDNLVVRRP